VLKIFKGIESYKSHRGACVTTGTFDGVHIGHRVILKRLSEMAQQSDLESVMVTFDPHPRKVLFPTQTGLRLLNTIEERLERLESCGIDAVIVQPFTLDFSRTSALIYVRDLLVGKVGMKKLVIGYDHQFGKNREGSIEQLRELAPLYGFDINEIPAQDIDDVKISSTKIRNALEQGDIQTANAYLDYCFNFSGIVVEGDQRGRKLGFPTANIEVENPDKIIPKEGVYAVMVEFGDQKHFGMLNIGRNPTFDDIRHGRIEVHLFDFNKNLYRQKLKINFHARMRDEFKFDNADALVEQLKKDEKQARSILI